MHLLGLLSEVGLCYWDPGVGKGFEGAGEVVDTTGVVTEVDVGAAWMVATEAEADPEGDQALIPAVATKREGKSRNI